MPKTLVVPTVFTAVDKMSGVVERMTGSIRNFARTNPTMKFFGGVRDGANAIFDKIVSLKTAVAGLALVAGGKQLYEQVLGVAELGDEIAKTSQIIGIGTSALQELQFAAMRENVTNETLVNSLEKLNKNVGDLKIGAGSLHTVLKATNPTLEKQLRNVQSNEEAFNLIVKAINKAPNVFKKAQLAQAAFGKAGMDMLKLIEVGPEGIAALRKEAQKLGIVMGTDAINGAAAFADASDNMEASLKGLKYTIAGGLFPVVQGIIEKITAWSVANKDLIQTKVSEFGTKLASGLEWLANNIDKVVFYGKLFIGTLIALKVISIATTAVMWGITAATIAYNVAMGVMGAVTGVANIAIGGSAVALAAYKIAMVAGTAATWLFNAALAVLTSPITLIVLAIAAVAAAVYLVIKYWNQWGAAATAVFALISAPIAFIISLLMSLYRNWQMITDAFSNGGIMAGIKAIGVAIFDAILQPLQQILALAGKIPGMGWATSAAEGIGKFRESIGATTETGGSVAPAAAINPQQERQAAINSTTTNNKNQNVTVEFKNLPDGAKVSGGGSGNSAMPSLGSTMTFQ